MTTVRYGARSPVTAQGRLIAAPLMLLGIALVGSTTAAIATWFVESARDTPKADEVTGAARRSSRRTRSRGHVVPGARLSGGRSRACFGGFQGDVCDHHLDTCLLEAADDVGAGR